MTKSKHSKLFGLANTLSYRTLKTLHLLRGSITLCSLASIGFFIWGVYVTFIPTAAYRYRFFDISFNCQEQDACENELLKSCDPILIEMIRSFPHSLYDKPLKQDERRLLQWYDNKSDLSRTQFIMYDYLSERYADRNDGYVIKFIIPQHGPRKGKVSAPEEIKPYIQSAINRCIDQYNLMDFSGGGIIGKSEEKYYLYEEFYLAPSKWNQYLERGSHFLYLFKLLPVFFGLLLVFLLFAIPSTFITLAVLESILMLVFFSFKPRHQQSNELIQ